jgi:hypothetical protein
MTALPLATVTAAPITINNSSFETPNIAANTLDNVTPTDWTQATANVQRYVVDGTNLPGISGGKTGSQYALLGAWNSVGTFNYLTQDTSLNWSSLSVDDTLQVSFWVTYRSDLAPTVGTTSATLLLNYGDTGSTLSQSISASLIDDQPAGTWQQFSWTYTVTQTDLNLASANSWGAVNVGFGMQNAQSPPRQLAFDDVSLNYTAIPEPTPWALLAGSLAVLTVFRRRSTQRTP